MLSKMNQTSTLELVGNLIEKEALTIHFRKFLIIVNTFRWFLLLSCLSTYLFICLFIFKKKSEMSNKIGQLETRLQDSELEVSWQLSGYFMGTPDRETSRVDANWANFKLHSILDLRPPLFGLSNEQLFPLFCLTSSRKELSTSL